MAEGNTAPRIPAAPDQARWPAVLLALLFGALLAAATFVAYRERGEFGDEGSFCTIAQGILGGRLPYRDLFNEKPPLQYFWTAAVMAFGGPTLAGARIASSIALALTAGCIVLGPLRKRGNGLLAVGFMLATAAIAIRLEAYRNTADSTLALLYVLSAIFIGREPRRAGNVVVAGALQGLALGFRQTASASALVLLLSPGLTRRRAAFAFGLVAGLLAWLVPLAATGDFMDFVRAALLFHIGNTGAASYLGHNIDHRSSLIAWALILAAVGIGSRLNRAERIWALCWLLTAALAYFGRKEEFRLWPSAAAALAMLSWEAGLVAAMPSLTLRTLGAGLVAIATLVAGVTALQHLPMRHSQVESIAVALRRVTRPQDEVWAGPFTPFIYCLAQRRPASRYYFVLPWTAKPEVRGEIVRDILAKRPVIVIDRSVFAFDIEKLVPGIDRILKEQ